jgi:hypothetical protein
MLQIMLILCVCIWGAGGIGSETQRWIGENWLKIGPVRERKPYRKRRFGRPRKIWGGGGAQHENAFFFCGGE